MLNEKHNKIQVALLSTSTRRVMLPMIIEVIKNLRTKSPNKILTQHACKESLVYTVNNGKQPKKTMLCICVLLHFLNLFSMSTRQNQKKKGRDYFPCFASRHELYIRFTIQFLFLELQRSN